MKMMKRFMKQFRYGEKGFTLIELLVVIAILGVLAAVAIPNIGKFIGQGKTEAASAELHNVQTAVVAYMAVNSGVLPTAGGTAGALTDEINDYLVGGLAAVSYGVYSVAADGQVSSDGSQ